MSDLRTLGKPLDVGLLVEEVLTAMTALKREVEGYRTETQELRAEVAALKKAAAPHPAS